MKYVVTEKGHNFYWENKDLEAGTFFETDKDVSGFINLGLIMSIDDYVVKLQKECQINNNKIQKIEDSMPEFSWNLFKNKDMIQFNAESFLDENPLYYDKYKIWWKWNENTFCWEMVDEIEIINAVKKLYNAQGLNNQTIRKEFLTALKDEARARKPLDLKKTEIQFKNKIYDLKTNEIYDATSKYFCVNPLPYEFGDSRDTPVMDKLISEWVGEENKETMYQIIAYCCLPDYPLHHLFCFIGSGRNGKSKFQEMLMKFIGRRNCVSTELDALLNSRFETAKLHKKLVATMGETNFGTINKTSIIKKLTGQDLIGYEFKNKDPFDSYNYAKIIISSNSLPISEDTSDGFYRRWLIIDFPNEFQEGIDILSTIPEIEYNNLSLKIINILPGLLMDGKFKNQGSIEERKKKYILSSNPLSVFLAMCTKEDPENFVRDSEIYMAYCVFLRKMKKRVITRSEFQKVMASEGWERVRSNHKIGENYISGYYFHGIGLQINPKSLDFVQIVRFVKDFSISFPYIEANIKNVHNSHNLHNFEREFQETLKNMGIKEELIK